MKIDTRFIVLLNGMGIGTNLVAWVVDNPAFVSNMLLFAIPTAVFTILKGRQRLKHQSELHELEVLRKKQELQQDQDLFDSKLNSKR